MHNFDYCKSKLQSSDSLKVNVTYGLLTHKLTDSKSYSSWYLKNVKI